MNDHSHPVELAHHPLITGKGLIPTAPVNDFCNMAYRALLLRQPGVCFTAPSGAGKTCALYFLKQYIQQQIPGIVVVSHHARNQPAPSIRAFLRHFLKTIGHAETRGETSELSLRLAKRLVDLGRVSGFNLVVLLIDEAQAMSVEDFKFLKDTSNDLEREGVSLFTIIMGQEPDFSSVVDQLLDEGRLDLAGRFVSRILPFRNLKDKKDIYNIFEAMDMFESQNSKSQTWTEYFFPLAYASGFRFVSETDNMYRVLVGMFEKKSIALNIPARQFFSAVRNFYVDNAVHDAASSTLAFPKNSWLFAVMEAQVLPAATISGYQKCENGSVNIQR